MPKSDVPFGSEFGPNQVDLATVLELAKVHEGNGRAFTQAISDLYGWPLATAKNTRLGLRSYRLIDQDDRLTEVGEALLRLRNQPTVMYEEFARHILLDLRGLEIMRGLEAMRNVREPMTLQNISRFLRNLGIYAPPTGTHLSKWRGWLEKAGVFGADQSFESISMARASELLGLSEQQDIDALAEMPETQQAFLKSLANMPIATIPDEEPILASQVVEYAATVYGAVFDEKALVKTTLEPLQAAGYIALGKPPKATGADAGARAQISGKSTHVYRTERFANAFLERVVEAFAGTGLPVAALVRKSLAEILAEMESPDRNVKGKALEALAFYFMRLLDLEFRDWRRRDEKTFGAEVDVLVEGARLLFTRWQIQCKNTAVVALDEVAKEVGLSLHLNSNVILIVTTGRVAKDAQGYADAMMGKSNLNIVTLDGSDLRGLARNPLSIAPIMNAKARRAMEIKSLDK